MKTLIWKKWRELAKTPIKLLLSLLAPFILVIVYYFLFNVSFELNLIFTPVAASLFSTYLLFCVDDIAYSVFYRTLGIKIHKIWIVNILFIVIWNYVLTNLALFIIALFTLPSIDLKTIGFGIGNIIVVMAFIGLSTIHFLDGGTATTIVASIFAIANLLWVIVPLLAGFISSLEILNLLLIIISFIGFMFCNTLMKKSFGEKLIINTKEYIKGYDVKFFNEDED